MIEVGPAVGEADLIHVLGVRTIGPSGVITAVAEIAPRPLAGDRRPCRQADLRQGRTVAAAIIVQQLCEDGVGALDVAPQSGEVGDRRIGIVRTFQ